MKKDDYNQNHRPDTSKFLEIIPALKTMKLYAILFRNTSLNKEGGDVLPLIALELNNLSEFWILYYGTVAAELFLEVLEYFVVAVLFL